MNSIDSERDLLEVRAELKKFKKIEPKKVLGILKSIKECNAINKEWIRKTKITKTLVRISLHKYPSQDDVRIMVGKVAKVLVAKFRQLFPKLSQTGNAQAENSSANQQTSSAVSAPKPAAPQQQQQQKQVPQEQKKSDSSETKQDSSQMKDLPSYSNEKRNQGLQGIVKYFQKGFDESKMHMSNQICIEIEKFLSLRNNQNNTFNETNYKEDVKKLCKQFIDKENSTKTKNTIYDEFLVKKTGQLNCVKEILK